MDELQRWSCGRVIWEEKLRRRWRRQIKATPSQGAPLGCTRPPVWMVTLKGAAIWERCMRVVAGWIGVVRWRSSSFRRAVRAGMRWLVRRWSGCELEPHRCQTFQAKFTTHRFRRLKAPPIRPPPVKPAGASGYVSAPTCVLGSAFQVWSRAGCPVTYANLRNTPLTCPTYPPPKCHTCTNNGYTLYRSLRTSQNPSPMPRSSS